MKFSDEDKEVKEFADRIPFGVHKVQLTLAELGESDAGKEYIEVHVTTPEGVEDSARLWFTGGASNISFNALRQIVVHNAKTETQKASARDAVDAVADTEALVDLLNKHTIGGELWLTKYYDPKRTYQNAAGVTKRSINTNVYGYEPKPRPELMPDRNEQMLAEAMPGAEEVPFSSAGDAPGTKVAGETVPPSEAWAE